MGTVAPLSGIIWDRLRMVRRLEGDERRICERTCNVCEREDGVTGESERVGVLFCGEVVGVVANERGVKEAWGERGREKQGFLVLGVSLWDDGDLS